MLGHSRTLYQDTQILHEAKDHHSTALHNSMYLVCHVVNQAKKLWRGLMQATPLQRTTRAWWRGCSWRNSKTVLKTINSESSTSARIRRTLTNPTLRTVSGKGSRLRTLSCTVSSTTIGSRWFKKTGLASSLTTRSFMKGRFSNSWKGSSTHKDFTTFKRNMIVRSMRPKKITFDRWLNRRGRKSNWGQKIGRIKKMRWAGDSRWWTISHESIVSRDSPSKRRRVCTRSNWINSSSQSSVPAKKGKVHFTNPTLATTP